MAGRRVLCLHHPVSKVWPGEAGLSPATCHRAMLQKRERRPEGRRLKQTAVPPCALGPLAEKHVSCTRFLLGTIPPYTHTHIRPASSDLSLACPQLPWPVLCSLAPRLRE